MISCAAWVGRDVVRAQAGKKPQKGLQADEDFLNSLAIDDEEGEWAEDVAMDEDDDEGSDGSDSEDAGTSAGKAAKAKSAAKSAAKSVDGALAELDMDAYDDEDDEGAFVTSIYGGSRPGGAMYSGGSKEDPHIDDDQPSSDSEDDNDMVLRATDHMILAAKNEEDLSQLEVWVYEDLESEGNLYVHQDIILPAFALCVASGNFDPRDASGGGSNPPLKPMCAIGTFDPEIEIWDLTAVDSLQPAAVLGGYEEEEVPHSAEAVEGAGGSAGAGKKKKKKKKKKKAKMPERRRLKTGSHEDSVLALAWNWEYRNVLASGSADRTIKLWDLEKLECSATISHHEDKVQSVQWSPACSQVLASGGFDKRICLTDLREDGKTAPAAAWALSSDVESLIWDSALSPECFLVSCEDGSVAKFDTRLGAGSEPMWSLRAHEKACCDISLCAHPAAKGLLATASLDKSVKLWDAAGAEPELILSKKLKTGPVFTTCFTGEATAKPLVAVGGAKGELLVWNVMAEEEIAKKYPGIL